MNVRAVATMMAMGLTACSANVMPGKLQPDARVNVKQVPLALRIFIPTHLPHAHTPHGVLHQQFIAASSAAIRLKVFPHGRRARPVASFIGDISSSSHGCTAAYGGRVCSFSVGLPPGGPYDFVFATYDQKPSDGAIPRGARQLGAAVDTASVAVGKHNALHFTIGGVVARTFIHVPSTDLFHAIASRTESLSIGAIDADGNLIASDSYVNAAGTPLTITPKVDSNAGKTISFSPAKLTAPQTNGVAMRYSAIAATAVQLKSGFQTQVTADTGSVLTTGRLSLLVFPPTAAMSYSTDDGPHDVAVNNGSWVVSASSTNVLDTFYKGGPGIANTLPSADRAYGIAVDTFGAFWFAEAGIDKLGVVRFTGFGLDVTPGFASLSPGAAPTGITNGPDGAIWFTERGTNKIGRMENVPPANTITEYPIPTHNAGVQGITTGSDGAMWFAECTAGKIGRIPINAAAGRRAQFKEFIVPYSGGAFPLSLVAGPDGALWFTDRYSPYIGRITSNGTIAEYAIPSGSEGGEIAVAPDGALWFAETTGAKIGRILTSATTAHPGIIEFDAADDGSSPYGITVGPDGAVYFTEYTMDKVVEFQ